MKKYTISGLIAILFVLATVGAGAYLIYSGIKSKDTTLVTSGIALLAPTGVIVGHYFGVNNKGGSFTSTTSKDDGSPK